MNQAPDSVQETLARLQAAVAALTPDPAFADEPYIILTIQEAWRQLAENQIFEQARCAPQLSQLALDIFQITMPNNTTQRMARR